MLLVAGNGRNSGKTALVCNIIRRFGAETPLMAIKVSPHTHHLVTGGRIIYQDEHMGIIEEHGTDADKDSIRMLKAGATRSFFIMTSDGYLTSALRVVEEYAGSDMMLICESGGLRKWVEPGLFLLVFRDEQHGLKPGTSELMKYEHIRVIFDGTRHDIDLHSINIENSRWTIKKQP
jgi:hypothetical protein